jgi:hypothetical protein
LSSENFSDIHNNFKKIVIMNRLLKGPAFLFFIVFLSVIPISTGMAFEDDRYGQSEGDSPGGYSGFNLGAWLVNIYRDHISAVDSDRCPSLPSCSSYGASAFKKHGFFIGWLMTVDRLIHEGKEEAAVSPLVYSHGKWKIYDPVENNDFWWYPGSRPVKHHE